MATRDPVGTIDRDSPGRPPSVKRTVERIVAETLRVQLDAGGMLPCAMPKKLITGTCQRIARNVVREIYDQGLIVVPAKIARELILLVGTGAVDKEGKTDGNVET